MFISDIHLAADSSLRPPARGSQPNCPSKQRMPNCTDDQDAEEDSGATTVLIMLVICFIAISMGCTVTLEAFLDVWRTKRRAFAIGLFSQFVIMPLFSFGVAHAFDFEPRVAMGIVLVGSAPGGSTSNLLTHWAQGNVALSIAMSGTSTVCALFMLPLNVALYIDTGLSKDGDLSLPFVNIVVTLLTIVVPVSLGVLLRRRDVKCGRFPLHVWVEKVGNIIGALFLVAAVAFGAIDHPDLYNPGKYPGEWALAALFEPLGCCFGFAMATAARLEARDARAVSLETGVQNYALIIALIALSYDAGSCEREEVSRFVLISTLWYVISSAWIVTLMRVAARREASGEEHERPAVAHQVDAASLPGKVDGSGGTGGGAGAPPTLEVSVA